MCGIVGTASIYKTNDRSWLAKAQDTLTHRGPDDAGEWWSDDGRVGMAHRRLSILDLSPAGHQPMHLGEHGLSIVFNGEIYNFHELRNELMQLGYTFTSLSDTEVLLAAYTAWGTDCLDRLNGMFAFALYDSPQDQLFLARDRAGEKPLFYYLGSDAIYFASELKALMACQDLPRQIDPKALDCYLAMGYVPGDLCILKGFNKLPPAHAMMYDLCQGKARIWSYWDLPAFDSRVADNDEELLLNNLENLLEDAVGKQMVADVPVGILLSGGVDSSLVTAMAVRHSDKVRTFSIGFPGHAKMDETPHARLIAQYFGTNHTELMAQPTTADIIPQLARQFDEPMNDSSMIPTWLVSNLVGQHCTVALGGDGGDELFGGYSHYSQLLQRQNQLKFMPRPLRRLVAKTAERTLPVGLKGRNWLQGLDFDIRTGLPLNAKLFDPATRRRLLKNYPEHVYISETMEQRKIFTDQDLIQRATRRDFLNYLPEDILVKVDRTSMHNSLEIRAPFLDYRLTEFAFAQVPSNLKTTLQDKKILLKKLAAKVLPLEFDKQRKQGFSIPLSEWLKSGPFRDLFWDTLSSPDILFDQSTVKGLLKNQDRGFSNSERLFSLVQFELWRKTFDVSF